MMEWSEILINLIGPGIVTAVAIVLVTKRMEREMLHQQEEEKRITMTEKAKLDREREEREKEQVSVDFLKGEISKLQDKLNMADEFANDLLEKVGELKREKAEFETALKLLTNYLTDEK